MRIAVVGAGYVGLVVGAGLAENGNEVVCVDVDPAKVRALQRGKVPIYEPGLEELVKRNRAEKRLTYTLGLAKAVRRSAVVFIAVGTPSGEDGSADVGQVLRVARDVARAMTGYTVIVTKSTVPVGTAAKVREVIRGETTHPFSVVSNPEFLKQGAAVSDFMKPARVVIGADDSRGAEIVKELYAPLTRTGAPILVTDCASAELAKYAANAMLATRISFMNEVANVCERVGANVDDVRRAVASDPRIGSAFLFPGVGYGGSCFPKDVKALLNSAKRSGYECDILEAVEAVNERQKGLLVEKLKAHFGSLKGKRVAVWGLAFKPRTDDMREAPAVTIVERLLAEGAKVHAYDPVAERTARKVFGSRVTFAKRPYDAIKGADALAIVTEWNEFREPDFERMRALMREPVIADGRNVFTPQQMRAHGFTYLSIGRPA
ncbi:MAG: UDP-glucose/GDP-mannose dehydrogenase family protein [Vicinamibacterales bacterium]|nr:UDP-glucose/GDP-mannose dehydrogenase family protein [Vicinamibacterales bacterium]MDP6610108.1 UDP-glucose/GDP-mannose dehydrogenase family protein [Vicinamibacterales bacterium]|tara:strand:+ start:282 stop:1583 length:1302 start_codon:yes stop_codon:yes gene_type:complete